MKIQKRLVIWMALMVMYGVSGVVSVVGQPHTAAGIVPVLEVTSPTIKKEYPMELIKLDVGVRIVGQIAVTTLDMLWLNRNDRVMEGAFSFPLEEHQTISRFAIDIEGGLREGVVVDKELGRKTFEAIVRKNVDPGLLENTEGNNYRARIYPLPPKGTRRIVIAWEQELVDQGEYDLFLLPLNLQRKVKDFSLKVEIHQKSICVPDVSNEFPGLTFSQWDQALVTTIHRRNFQPDKLLALSFPHDAVASIPITKQKQQGAWISGKVMWLAIGSVLYTLLVLIWFLKTRRKDYLTPLLGGIALLLLLGSGFLIFQRHRNHPGKHPMPVSANAFAAPMAGNADSAWFYLTMRPHQSVRTKPTPGHITILWDNSFSSRNRNFEREYQLLELYMKNLGSLTVTLVPFNVSREQPEQFSIRNGNFAPLRSRLEKMVYDGATSLGTLLQDSLGGDEVLLFTDGMSNFGEQVRFGTPLPVYAINSSVSAHHSMLQGLADASGGAYINLNSTTVRDASEMLGQMNYQFLSAEVIKGGATECYPSIPVSFRNTFTMAGKMGKDGVKLRLHFGVQGEVVYTETVDIKPVKSDDSDLLRRIWAGKKIRELLMDETSNSEAIAAAGKAHGIVTPTTSLIVLESLDDYVRFGIEPPEGMREKYWQLVDTDDRGKKLKIQEKIKRMIALADEQTSWWNTRFLEQPINPKPSPNSTEVPDASPVQVTSPDMVAETQLQNSSDTASTQAVANVSISGSIQAFANAEVSGATSPSYVYTANYAWSSNATSQNMAHVGFYTVNNSTAHQNGSSGTSSAQIQLNAWDPKTPYLRDLRRAKPDQAYAVYLRHREKHGSTPAFFIDVSDYFSRAGKGDLALRVLSNLAEIELEAPQLLRIMGLKLQDFGLHQEAARVFAKVLKMRGEEPQSYRDLGLAWEAAGMHDKAVEVLYKVVEMEWDERFEEIEMIALNDINGIIARHPKTKHGYIDKRLIRKEPVDLRVVLTWDHDNTDIDLWVTDPEGIKCYYSNKLTPGGGKMSRDFTQGYGPEEFMIRKAYNGEYIVEADYYGTSSQALLAPVNLHLTFITHFGKANEKREQITVRLKNQKEVVNVGKFRFSARR
jgi:hypothetical protein